jgi:hypothetical protein
VPPVQARAFEQTWTCRSRHSGGEPHRQSWKRRTGRPTSGCVSCALPDTLSQAQLGSLDRAFELTRTGNSEILFAWLRVAIRNRYEPALPALERFLTTQGRRKFVAPLYQDLMNTTWGEEIARRIYRQARPTYHSVTTGTVDQIVGPAG